MKQKAFFIIIFIFHHLVTKSIMADTSFKLTILIFWIKFAQKGYFQSKTIKVKIILESCILELVSVANFGLN